MDLDQKQITVPFGKYSGKPVERLIQDVAYARWLVGQDWFREKFQNMYALIVHNYHSDPVDTPEHNKMQIRFMNVEHAIKLAFLVSNSTLFNFDNSHFKVFFPSFAGELNRHNAMTDGLPVPLQEIEERFRKIDGKDLLEISEIEFEQKGLDVSYDISYGYGSVSISEGTYHRAPRLFDSIWKNSVQLKMRVELKPTVGDDFPSVLRQMRASGAKTLVLREYTGAGVPYDDVKSFFLSQGIGCFTEQEIDRVSIPDYDRVFKFDAGT